MNGETHRLLSLSFGLAKSIVVDVLRQQDVDVDPRLGGLADVLHVFAETITQQLLSDASVCRSVCTDRE